MDITKPLQPAVLNFERRIHNVRLLMQFRIGGLVGLVDIADLMISPTAVGAKCPLLFHKIFIPSTALLLLPLADVFVSREGALRDETKNGLEED